MKPDRGNDQPSSAKEPAMVSDEVTDWAAWSRDAVALLNERNAAWAAKFVLPEGAGGSTRRRLSSNVARTLSSLISVSSVRHRLPRVRFFGVGPMRPFRRLLGSGWTR